RQPTEAEERNPRRAVDDAGAGVVGGDVEERDEDDGLGEDEAEEGGVLRWERLGAVGGAAGEPADDHEAAEDEEPVDREERLGDDLGEAAHEEVHLDAGEEEDGAE